MYGCVPHCPLPRFVKKHANIRACYYLRFSRLWVCMPASASPPPILPLTGRLRPQSLRQGSKKLSWTPPYNTYTVPAHPVTRLIVSHNPSGFFTVRKYNSNTLASGALRCEWLTTFRAESSAVLARMASSAFWYSLFMQNCRSGNRHTRYN